MVEHSDKADNHDKSAASQESGTGKPVLPPASLKGSIKPAEAQIIQDDRAEHAKEISESVKRFVKWGKVVSAFVTAAVIAQAVTSFFQLREMQRQNQVIIDQNKVAQGQLDQMVLDQRPWLSITEPTLEGFSLADILQGRPAVGRFKVSNPGKTPAMIVEGTIDLILDLRHANTDMLMEMVDTKKKMGGRQVVIPPDETVSYTIQLTNLHHRIDPKMFDPPLPWPPDSPPPPDHGALWLVGRLHYEDSSGRRHGPTECCYRYDVQAKAFVTEGEHNRM